MSHELAADILAHHRADQIPPEPVQVFGRELHVKHWSARERAQWEAIVFDRTGEKPTARHDIFMAATVVMSLVNGDGRPVFSRDQIEDVAELDVAELEKAHAVAVRVNNLDRNQVADAKKN